MSEPTHGRSQIAVEAWRPVLGHRASKGVAAVFVLVVGFSVLNLRPWDMPLYEDEGETIAEVRRRVPVGSTVAAARRTLEDGGFDCREERGVRMDGRILDLLYCSEGRHINRWRFPLFEGRWQVWFELDGEVTTELGLSYSVIAL